MLRQMTSSLWAFSRRACKGSSDAPGWDFGGNELFFAQLRINVRGRTNKIDFFNMNHNLFLEIFVSLEKTRSKEI
jgi:hypothetical protein